MSDRFLSRREIESLTGRRRPSAQRRVLDRQGIAYHLRADGYPAVPSAALTATKPDTTATEPNWAPLRCNY